jgi:hypothetical protein
VRGLFILPGERREEERNNSVEKKGKPYDSIPFT